MAEKIKKFSMLTGFVIVGLLAGIIMTAKFDIFPFNISANQQGTGQVEVLSEDIEIEPSPEALGLERSFVRVAHKAGNAVVSISTEVTEKISSRRFYFSPFGEDDFFGRDKFFDRFFEEFFGSIPEREFKRRGLGSGVIIGSEGYILTNQHVIENSDKITVTLSDGREFEGEMKGQDIRSDLAVIKIDANNLPVLELGNSKEVKIGQWVVAIGNPFGFAVNNPQPTVTVGIISALERSLPRTSKRDRIYSGLIQTDAAINPGNSGGPLVNLKGEIIGINVAIFTTSGGYQGVGFAIPINRAKRILSRLKQGEEILYGWLGVYIQDIDRELADYFNLPDQKGILITKIIKDSPAEKSGFKNGDIIRKFNEVNVDDTQHLVEIVSSTKVGRRVTVEIIRDTKRMNLEVEVGKRPSEIEKYVSEPGETEWRGMNVEELTSEIADRYNLDIEKGLLIVEVESGNLAQKAGLSEGDIIISINKETVENLDNFKKVITKIGNNNALVQTDKGYVVLKGEE